MDPTPPQLPPISAGNHRGTADCNSPPPPSHPPYPEMIMAAFECENWWEKEEVGLTEREIAMYIHRSYTHLPPTHSSELTRHLKRLAVSGQLLLINNSYHLPNSLRSNTTTNLEGLGSVNGSGLVKRGRGRPRKNCDPGLAQAQPREVAHYVMVSYTEMGLNDECKVLDTDTGVGKGNGSVLVERERGRPMKIYGLGLKNCSSRVGKKVGRPKNKIVRGFVQALEVVAGLGAGLENGSVMGKWGVGSPQENIGPNLSQAQARSQEGMVPDMGMGVGLESGSSLVKRGVGRPRKKIEPSVAHEEALAQAQLHEAMAPGSSIGGPHDEIGPGLTDAQAQVVLAMVSGNGLDDVSMKRRRGRPRKGSGSSLVKKGVGRPRKKIEPSVAHDEAQAQAHLHEAMAPGSSIGGPHDEIGPGLIDAQAQVDEAMVSGNGLDDVSMKRRRGRPRKGSGSSLVKRGVGRPRKKIEPSVAHDEAEAQAHLHEAMAPGSSIGGPHDEIGPGLTDAQAQVDEAMVSGNGLDDVSMKRRRGRPRKGTWPSLGHAQAQAEALRKESSLGIRGRLRPRTENESGPSPSPSPNPSPSPSPSPDPVEARKYLLGKRGRPVGRPVGRPPKEWTHQQQQEMMNPTVLKPTLTQVLAANEELQTMLEEMQSKLKVAVGVIRPNLATQSAPDVVAALQQLEQLSTMKPTTSAALDTGLTAQLQSTSAPNSLGASGPKVVDFTAPPAIPLHFDMNFPSI